MTAGIRAEPITTSYEESYFRANVIVCGPSDHYDL